MFISEVFPIRRGEMSIVLIPFSKFEIMRFVSFTRSVKLFPETAIPYTNVLSIANCVCMQIYIIFRKVHKFVVHEFVNRYLADFSAKVRRTCQ